MNSKINEKPEQGFPKLMKSKHGELIVLFSTESTGTVVHVGPGWNWKIGDSRNSFDNNTFQEFGGEVVLSN